MNIWWKLTHPQVFQDVDEFTRTDYGKFSMDPLQWMGAAADLKTSQ